MEGNQHNTKLKLHLINKKLKNNHNNNPIQVDKLANDHIQYGYDQQKYFLVSFKDTTLVIVSDTGKKMASERINYLFKLTEINTVLPIKSPVNSSSDENVKSKSTKFKTITQLQHIPDKLSDKLREQQTDTSNQSFKLQKEVNIYSQNEYLIQNFKEIQQEKKKQKVYCNMFLVGANKGLYLFHIEPKRNKIEFLHGLYEDYDNIVGIVPIETLKYNTIYTAKLKYSNKLNKLTFKLIRKIDHNTSIQTFPSNFLTAAFKYGKAFDYQKTFYFLRLGQPKFRYNIWVNPYKIRMANTNQMNDTKQSNAKNLLCDILEFNQKASTQTNFSEHVAMNSTQIISFNQYNFETKKINDGLISQSGYQQIKSKQFH
eukprot:403349497